MEGVSEPTTVVDVADLYRRPGTSRRAEVRVPADVTIELPLTHLDGDVEVSLLLESLVDGVLARGRVSAPATRSCARCLAEIPATLAADDVVELFGDAERVDDEPEPGYVIEVGEGRPAIDVDVLVRDALAAAADERPLCRAECAGLCATCGADRNEVACACADADVDPRWEALRGLTLPEGPVDVDAGPGGTSGDAA